MASRRRPRRRSWSSGDEQQFRRLVRQNTPTRDIARKLRRTPQAIRSKAHQMRMSLRPYARSRRRAR